MALSPIVSIGRFLPTLFRPKLYVSPSGNPTRDLILLLNINSFSVPLESHLLLQFSGNALHKSIILPKNSISPLYVIPKKVLNPDGFELIVTPIVAKSYKSILGKVTDLVVNHSIRYDGIIIRLLKVQAFQTAVQPPIGRRGIKGHAGPPGPPGPSGSTATTVVAPPLIVGPGSVSPAMAVAIESGLVVPATAATLTRVKAIGVSVDPLIKTPAQQVQIQVSGVATVLPESPLSIGEDVWISLTPGMVTSIPPSGPPGDSAVANWSLGIAISPTEVVLSPGTFIEF